MITVSTNPFLDISRAYTSANSPLKVKQASSNINSVSRSMQTLAESFFHQYSPDPSLIQICSKSQCGLIWTETGPPSRFHGNPSSSFCVILPINKQTDRHRWKHDLAGGTVLLLMSNNLQK